MAITYGTITTDYDTSNPTVDGFNHDNGGADALIVVYIPLVDGGNGVTGVTYNSVSLTEIGVSDSNTNPSPEIWAGYLLSPASGTNSVVVTETTGPRAFVTYAIPVSGLDEADFPGAIATDSGTDVGTEVSSALTTETDGSDHFLVAGFRDGTNAPPLSPGTGMTELAEQASGTSTSSDLVVGLYYKTVATAGSSTATADASSSETNKGLSFEIKVGAGGGGSSASPAASMLGL